MSSKKNTDYSINPVRSTMRPHHLDEIILHFEQANLYCYTEFVSLLKHWRIEIIHSFHRPYENRRQSNALAESLNEKIRELLVVSHGFSNF